VPAETIVAILNEIKFYHRKMGREHRVDIARTALHMRRIPKQKLIKQHIKLLKNIISKY